MKLRKRTINKRNFKKNRVIKKITRIAFLLTINNAITHPSQALTLLYTPRKINNPTIERLQDLSPSKIHWVENRFATKTPRNRTLREKSSIKFSGGEISLLIPEDESFLTLSYQDLKAPEIPFMPEHDPTITQNLDICIDYNGIIEHQEHLRKLPNHRQKPGGCNIFVGSAHQKIQEAMSNTVPPKLHWCHILAQSLKPGTQFPENFLIGTPQANASMLLFEAILPDFLKQKHQEQGPLSNPCVYLDLFWTYQNEHLRIGDKLTYRIKNAPGNNPTHYLEKTFSMMSQEKTPNLAIEFTKSRFEEEFKHLSNPTPPPLLVLPPPYLTPNSSHSSRSLRSCAPPLLPQRPLNSSSSHSSTKINRKLFI